MKTMFLYVQTEDIDLANVALGNSVHVNTGLPI